MKLTKDFKKVYYDTRRHIRQKTPADCDLTSTAMYANLSWDTIVDLYAQEILSTVATLSGSKLNKNDPDYYEKLFQQYFYDLNSGFAGMTSLTSGWLFDVLGMKKFIEVPFLIRGIPCLISTVPVSVKDPSTPSGYHFEGHAMYFDGYFIYDPNWDANRPQFKGRARSTTAAMKMPPFTTFTYYLDDLKEPAKFFALIDSLYKSFFDASNEEYNSKYFKDVVMSNFFIIDTVDNFGAVIQSEEIVKNEPNALIVSKKQVLDLEPIEWKSLAIYEYNENFQLELSNKIEHPRIMAIQGRPIKLINKEFKDRNVLFEHDNENKLMEYPDKEYEWYQKYTPFYRNYDNSDDFWDTYLTIEEVKEKISSSKYKTKSHNDPFFLRRTKRNPVRKINPYSKQNPITYIHKIEERSDFNYYEIIAYDGSIEVGHYIFVLHLSPKKKLIVEDSFTHPVYRRRGVATKAYDYIENLTGMKITPVADEQTEEASHFWKKRQSMKPNPVTSKRTNEKLWKKVKEEAVDKMGGHSARAMQYAVKLYKDRGGKYIGKKRVDNDLATWTRAKWQYAPDSKSKDRYLPKEAWKKLSKEEILATRKKKKGKMGEWVENTEKAKRAAREATKKARKNESY